MSTPETDELCKSILMQTAESVALAASIMVPYKPFMETVCNCTRERDKRGDAPELLMNTAPVLEAALKFLSVWESQRSVIMKEPT